MRMLLKQEVLNKMNDADWARYLCETVYVLWYCCFTAAMPSYGPQFHYELMSFARKLFSEKISRKLKPMTHSELIYRKLFEACGHCRLKEDLVELFREMKKAKIEPDKVTFGTFYHSVSLAN